MQNQDVLDVLAVRDILANTSGAAATIAALIEWKNGGANPFVAQGLGRTDPGGNVETEPSEKTLYGKPVEDVEPEEPAPAPAPKKAPAKKTAPPKPRAKQAVPADDDDF